MDYAEIALEMPFLVPDDIFLERHGSPRFSTHEVARVSLKRPYHAPALKKYQNVETMPFQQRATAQQLLEEAEMEFMKTEEDDQNRLNN